MRNMMSAVEFVGKQFYMEQMLILAINKDSHVLGTGNI